MSLPFNTDPFNFTPEVFLFPDQYNDDFRLQLRKYLNNMAIALSAKENGFYVEEETPTAGLFIPLATPNSSANVQFRAMYRTVVDFGALPDNGTKTVPHGITTTQDYSIIRFDGVATDPGATTIDSAIPLPFVGNNPLEVEMEMDATDIIITTGSDRTNYTRTFIVIEYIKEV